MTGPTDPALRALAREGAAFMHLNNVGIFRDHTGTFDTCTSPRCEQARAAVAAEAPDTETVCAFRGCGLPKRLHGAPPGEPPNPTSSTHRFIPDTETAGEAG